MAEALDISELRRRAGEQRKREIALVESRYAEALRHIDGLAPFFGENSSSSPLLANDPVPDRKAKYRRWPGFRKAVWEAASGSAQGFSAPDIVGFFQGNYPSYKFANSNIASELWRLRKAGKISLKERGISRKPHIYEINNGQSEQEGKV
jgi:hypothetical protein